MSSCEVCQSQDAFDLYLGELMCRSCKRQRMAQEYGWSK